jgi:hypothetical protein
VAGRCCGQVAGAHKSHASHAQELEDAAAALEQLERFVRADKASDTPREYGELLEQDWTFLREGEVNDTTMMPNVIQYDGEALYRLASMCMLLCSPQPQPHPTPPFEILVAVPFAARRCAFETDHMQPQLVLKALKALERDIQTPQASADSDPMVHLGKRLVQYERGSPLQLPRSVVALLGHRVRYSIAGSGTGEQCMVLLRQALARETTYCSLDTTSTWGNCWCHLVERVVVSLPFDQSSILRCAPQVWGRSCCSPLYLAHQHQLVWNDSEMMRARRVNPCRLCVCIVCRHCLIRDGRGDETHRQDAAQLHDRSTQESDLVVLVLKEARDGDQQLLVEKLRTNAILTRLCKVSGLRRMPAVQSVGRCRCCKRCLRAPMLLAHNILA